MSPRKKTPKPLGPDELEALMPPEPREPKETYVPLKLLGLEIPLPRWAVYCVALIAVVACGLFLWGKLAPVLEIEKVKLSPGEYQQIAEAQKHFTEKPTAQTQVVSDTAHGLLEVWFYDSDGCVFVSRRTPGPFGRMVNAWVLDPTRVGPSSPAPIAVAPPSAGGLVADPAFAGGGDTRNPENTCGGRCPPDGEAHPGNFEWWTEPTSDECWVRTWRRWPDRCTHWQLFNRCYNYWATRSDGFPDIHWTCCVH